MTIRNAEMVEALRNAMPQVLPAQTFREDEDIFAAQRIFLQGAAPYPFLLTARKQKNGRIQLRLGADAHYGIHGVNRFQGIPTANLTATEFLDEETLVNTITELAKEEQEMFIPRVRPTQMQEKDYDKMTAFVQMTRGNGTLKEARDYLATYGMNRW
jgi:hypothetical protein